nr:MAG TPA: hypothetical protein [Caudoviricetes sp.]
MNYDKRRSKKVRSAIFFIILMEQIAEYIYF